jgi:hypothetical protein
MEINIKQYSSRFETACPISIDLLYMNKELKWVNYNEGPYLDYFSYD